MPAGLQIWDASGTLIFDTTTQTIKFFGTYIIGPGGDNRSSGTITDSRFSIFAGHVPFFVQIEGGTGSSIRNAATWTFSGNNLNWSYPVPSSRATEKIIYGVIGQV